MRKFISLLLSLCFTFTAANAKPENKILGNLNINQSAVSVSIKDISTGNSIFSLNDKMPMMPASTLKVVTSSAAVDTLGKDFKFTTKLYKSVNNDLYFKLSGDPFLTYNDLLELLEDAKLKNIISPKNIYTDASVFDNVEWGEGWQWDDDLNPLMPKFSAYNLDGNLLKIEVTPGVNNTPATITVKPFYPITFMNLVNTDLSSGENKVILSRNNSIAPNVISANGTISKTQILQIPVNNPKMYFSIRLTDAIREKKLDYFKSVNSAVLPEKNVYLVGEITHELLAILSSILKYSNNMSAETLFKIAGAKWSKEQGNIENSLSMMNNYLEKINIDSQDIKIVDGSGVSKNNIVTADFMTKFLVYKSSLEDFEDFKAMLPAPGEGTLKNRMLYFKDNLNAKTGTLSGTSAIVGYIKSRKGKIYAFGIMINDAKTSAADKKNIEEQILRQVYMNY